MTRRPYLETQNAGHDRWPQAALDQLNRCLETLEQRLGPGRAEAPGRQPVTQAPAENATAPHPAAGSGPDVEASPERQRPFGQRGSHEMPYQGIARDIERLRGEQDGARAAGRIAAELMELREELRHRMTAGVHGEFQALRRDLERAHADKSGSAAHGLVHDFERISSAVQALAERSDDAGLAALRQELEAARTVLEKLARQATTPPAGRRLSPGGVGTDAEPRLSALADRLEEIASAVNNLPESLSLRSLDEKLRTLAAAIEHFVSHPPALGPETFAQMEVRLDEISRAIVASTIAAQSAHLDPQPFERIEARIAGLARQIEELAEDRPTGELMERLSALSERVEELAARTEMPEKSVERLASRIAAIAANTERASGQPDADAILSGIDQRFDVLSGLLERRQGDAIGQGAFLRELERRLDEAAGGPEKRQTGAGPDGDALLQAVDARLAAIAERLEDAAREKGSGGASALEARLDDISQRLDLFAGRFAGIDPDLLRNLESQVAGLSAHLTRPGAPLPEFEDLGPRLEAIERRIAESRQGVLEAACQAAENAARSLAGKHAESAAVTGLAEDLKALEMLARRSDERNSRTFEAIHDTLLKIVDRLASMESGSSADAEESRSAPGLRPQQTSASDLDAMLAEDIPSDAAPQPQAGVGRSPAEAAAAAAAAVAGAPRSREQPAAGRGRSIRSMLGGLLPGRKAPEKHTPPDLEPEDETPVEAAPPVSLEAPLDPKFANRPLEPGSGAPDLNAIMRRVRDERGQSAGSGDADAAKSDFIAAARRAAQAAAAEAEVLKRKSDIGGPVKALRLADVLKSRRKQILMVGTGIAIALGGLQLGKVLMNDPVETAANGAPPVVVARLNAASPGDVSAPPASEGIADEETVVAAPVAGGGQSEEFAVRGMAAQAGLPNAALEQASATHSAASGTIEVAASVQPAAASAQPPAPLEVPVEAGPPALRRAAGSGDPRALFEVASRFAEGRGARQDLAEAAKWYQKAAELGLAPAQFRIGNFYEKGLGVARDIDRSKSWYHRAAEHGNASAMHNLAVLYAMGVDGTADNEKAARWFVSAAELGVKDSQFNLGVLAAKGVGMPQDLAESYKWFAVLAMSGDSDAAGKRDEIARALSPEKLATARVAAEQWKPKPLDAVANAVDVPDEWQDGKDETAVDMDEAIGNVRVTLDDNRL